MFLWMTLASSLLIIYEDFTRRTIHIVALILFGITSFTYNYHKEYLLATLVPNLFFLLVTFLILRLYIFFKKNKKQKMVGRYLGLGDIVILVLLCTSYSLYNFIFLILSACIMGLMYFTFANFLLNKKIIRIPFAGCIAAIHFILTLSSFIVSFDVTNTNLF